MPVMVVELKLNKRTEGAVVQMKEKLFGGDERQVL